MQTRQTKNKERIMCAFQEEHLLTLKQLAVLLDDIDFSTLYRNVKKFTEDGILKEVHIDTDTTAYELSDHAHDHFVCDSCNDIETVHLDTQQLSKRLPKGFEVTLGQNIIHGFCNKCK